MRLFSKLALIVIIMLSTMTIYELIKQLLHPDISIWESHIITIIFSTLMATFAGYIILKKLIKLNIELHETNKKNKEIHQQLEENIKHLNELLSEVNTLSGLLPICSSCKKIRDDQGYWNKIESFISKNSDAKFSHSLCPECIKKLYPKHCDKIINS